MCISLMAMDIEQFFQCLLVICSSSFKESLFGLITHFNWFFCLYTVF